MSYVLNRRAVLQVALERDLTVVDLAEQAGVHRVTLHKALSRTAPSEPTLSTACRLAKALNLAVEDIVTEVAS